MEVTRRTAKGMPSYEQLHLTFDERQRLLLWSELDAEGKFDVDTNGLQESLLLAPAPESYLELVVRFTRGTRVRGTIYWPQESRLFDLVWAARDAEPQWVGTIHPGRAVDNAG